MMPAIVPINKTETYIYIRYLNILNIKKQFLFLFFHYFTKRVLVLWIMAFDENDAGRCKPANFSFLAQNFCQEILFFRRN